MKTPRRFVLLHHEGHGAAHFDLMLEADTALATWQFSASPALLAAGGGLPCRRLADHRKAYLDYEGAVGGDRGHVTREDGGACELISESAERWLVALQGQHLRGRYTLSRRSAGWSLTQEPVD